jgi:hypothetical protein
VTCATTEAIVIESDREIIKIRANSTSLKRQNTAITDREIRTLFDIVRNEEKIKRIWK